MSTTMTVPPRAEPKPAATTPASNVELIERALVKGDLSALNTEQRLAYLRQLCDSLGLNALTRPFDFFTDKKTGKVTLYARKDCTEQLRKIHGVTLEVTGHDVVFDDCLVVNVKATIPCGKGKRHDEDIGVVSVEKLRGEDKANALMKALTKAKRRVTLSICGLGGIPDESEIDDSPRVNLPREVNSHTTPDPSGLPEAGLPEVAPAPALAALVEPTTATAAQVQEITRLKAELGLTGDTWQAFLASWFGVKPSAASPMVAAEMIAELHARLAGIEQDGALVGSDGIGPDGLPVLAVSGAARQKERAAGNSFRKG